MNAHDQQPLLSQACNGDAGALGSLLESLKPYILGIVRVSHGGRSLPNLNESDLVQEVMVQALHGFLSFRGKTLAEFTGWLRQVALRTTQHTLRAMDRHPPSVVTPEMDGMIPARGCHDPLDQAIRRETVNRIAEALARLPEEMQQVLIYRLADQLDHTEIASHMGRSVGAVRMIYLRAIRRLREVLQD